MKLSLPRQFRVEGEASGFLPRLAQRPSGPQGHHHSYLGIAKPLKTSCVTVPPSSNEQLLLTSLSWC